jgi:transcriptional regulator with XRE-family HTH domain
MSSSTDPSSPPPRHESADSLLAKNLVAARIAKGISQEALSAASDISRATIATLETGSSDPRLSTIAAIARSLGLPTSFLLLGEWEIRAVAALQEQLRIAPQKLEPRELRRLNEWVASGMLRDRADAARFAAQWAASTEGASPSAAVMAAIFAAFLPEPGAVVGAALGGLIDSKPQRPSDEP